MEERPVEGGPAGAAPAETSRADLGAGKDPARGDQPRPARPENRMDRPEPARPRKQQNNPNPGSIEPEVEFLPDDPPPRRRGGPLSRRY